MFLWCKVRPFGVNLCKTPKIFCNATRCAVSEWRQKSFNLVLFWLLCCAIAFTIIFYCLRQTMLLMRVPLTKYSQQSFMLNVYFKRYACLSDFKARFGWLFFNLHAIYEIYLGDIMYTEILHFDVYAIFFACMCGSYSPWNASLKVTFSLLSSRFWTSVCHSK